MKYELKEIEDENFDKIELTLGDYLEKHNISIYALAHATKIDWAIVKKYASSNNIFRMDRILLSKILTSLHCELDDIMYYKNENKLNEKISSRKK